MLAFTNHHKMKLECTTYLLLRKEKKWDEKWLSALRILGSCR